MKLAIFLFGTGMYVIGRKTKGFGTIFPAIFEFARQYNQIDLSIYVFATSEKSKVEFLSAYSEFQKLVIHDDQLLEVKVIVGSNEDIIKENVLNTSADIKTAIIAIPDKLHFKYISICGNLNLNVLTVKPFVENIEQANELINLFNNKDIYGCVEFHKRFDTSNILARDMFQNGKLGLLNSVVVEYSQRISIPTEVFSSWSRETNIFQYLGVHYIDQIFFVTKASPQRAMAIGCHNKLKTYGIDVEDEIHSIIEWKLNNNLFYSTIRTSWIDSSLSSAMSDQKISYYGSEGHLRLDQKNRGVEFLSHTLGHQDINPYFTLHLESSGNDKTFSGYGIDSVVYFLADLLDLKSGKITLEKLSMKRPVFADVLASVAVSEAVTKSLSNNSTWIEVNL